MREWIVANGLGGYSSLTSKLSNNRKYHGLLVASLNPPTERHVFVSNIFDEIEIENKKINLIDFKPSFSFDLFPKFTYDFEEFKLTKKILMEKGKNTTIINYKVEPKKPIDIIHNPIVNSRHIYDVNRERYLSFETNFDKEKLTIKPSNTDKKIKIFTDNFDFEERFYWQELYYNKDHERRDSWIDNNVHIGKIIKKIDKETEYNIVLTLEDKLTKKPEEIIDQEINRKKDLIKNSDLPKKFEKLVLSSDNFIVNKEKGKSIIAGYHWFGDWGRDSLISLPGLTLVTKRFNDAKKILLGFSKYTKNGLIPNAFMERDSVAVYNTVDASLWYIDRVFQYLKYTNDIGFLKKIWPTLNEIIDGYRKGTDFEIKMDEDYLISHGPGLTWMDVKIYDYYPTPRFRKAVEIQALWYNALLIMSVLSDKIDKKDIYLDISEKLKKSFNKKYTLLYDVIDTEDFSIRPNMIFLVSLDFSMISKEKQVKIVEKVQEKLLTIFGLRTLSPDDQNYKAYYIGDYNKDISYHNGIVWTWPLGSFIKSYLKVKNYKEKDREYAYNNFLKPMLQLYGDKWDGSINEIFDAEPVYAPRGCINQAWSVAEILRTWVEDIENKKPKYEKEYVLDKISV